MKVPFIGGSYQMDALSFDVQRTINMYPLVSESGTSKSVSALRKCPGLELFTTAGGGEIRGCISSTSGRAFVVSGFDFYEVNQDGTVTDRGTLNTATGKVSIAENFNQIIIVDGRDGWIFTKATNNFAQITDIAFPACSMVAYQDGYFIVIRDGTQEFYISAIEDGTSWDALDFSEAQSSPDNLNGVVSNNGVLWLFGNRSTEVFQNTGSAAFPFERIDGAIIQTGCAAPFTLAKLDNSVFWLGVDEYGRGVVWRSRPDAYDVTKISTQGIERLIDLSEDFSESFAWVYHEQGHAYYVLQVKELDTTLVFDVSTNQWHERQYRNPLTGKAEQHRGGCHMFFKQRNLVGDRETGKIYDMDLSHYDDDGDIMVVKRISPHYADEKRFVSFSSFELDCEVGVGLNNGQGSDPKIMLRYSDDGGRTWSNELWTSLGKIGEHFTRVIWRRLGRGRDRVFEVSVSDPVFVQFNEAMINAT